MSSTLKTRVLLGQGRKKRGIDLDGPLSPTIFLLSASLPRSRVNERVVVDGNLTTSRGPGTSFEFALSLVQQLFGEEKMQQVAGPMVMPPS